MKIAVANDHRGFPMKKSVMAVLEELGHEPMDYGCFDENPVDYPDLAYAAGTAVVKKQADRAILICSAGIRLRALVSAGNL